MEYEDSLRQDMNKDQEKKQEEEEITRLELLRRARGNRVEEEPTIYGVPDKHACILCCI